MKRKAYPKKEVRQKLIKAAYLYCAYIQSVEAIVDVLDIDWHNDLEWFGQMNERADAIARDLGSDLCVTGDLTEGEKKQATKALLRLFRDVGPPNGGGGN